MCEFSFPALILPSKLTLPPLIVTANLLFLESFAFSIFNNPLKLTILLFPVAKTPILPLPFFNTTELVLSVSFESSCASTIFIVPLLANIPIFLDSVSLALVFISILVAVTAVFLQYLAIFLLLA